MDIMNETFYSCQIWIISDMEAIKTSFIYHEADSVCLLQLSLLDNLFCLHPWLVSGGECDFVKMWMCYWY